MSELEDLLALYGAIDRAVVDRPELAEVVAPYLRPYEPSPDGESAAGWFEEFTTWTAERQGREAIARLGSPSDALASLAETDPSDPLHGKRLVAIAVLARLRGGLADEDAVGEADLSAALRVGDADDELLRLLLDDDAFGSLADWQGLLHRANAEGHLSDAGFATLLSNERLLCSGKLVPVRVRGTATLAATLTTAFCIDKSKITFEKATRFLDPTTWPACNGLWCSMTEEDPPPGGNRIFHEVVSVNCAAEARSWTAEACLEFEELEGPGLKGVNYRLCKGHPKPGAMILVDEGSLTVTDGVGEICITTTKRIRFDHPFNGAALSMVMCTLGYGHVSEALVLCAAQQAGRSVKPKAAHKTLPPKTAPDANPVDDAVAAATKCLDECGAAVTASYDKAMAGSYCADDLVGDMAKMWARMLRDSAVALDLGMRAVRPIGGYLRGAATANQGAEP